MTQMPVGDPTMQNMQQQIADLRKEIEDLRRQVSPEANRKPDIDTTVFSHPGAPLEGTISPPYIYHKPRGYLTRAVITAYLAGATETVVYVLRKSGATGGPSNDEYERIATLTLDANDKVNVMDDLMPEVEDLDMIVLQIGDAPAETPDGDSVGGGVGVGMSDLTVTLTFAESVE